MNRERALKVVLVLVGLLFSAGIYPVTDSLWHANQAMLYRGYDAQRLCHTRHFLAAGNSYPICESQPDRFAHAAVMAVMAFQKADERLSAISAPIPNETSARPIAAPMRR